MEGRVPRGWWPVAVALACLSAGCYSGLPGGPEDESPFADDAGEDGADGANDDADGDGGDAADDGAGDDGGDDGAPEAGEPNESLRRLTQLQFRNTVADLIGYQPEALDSLPPDEKAGAFDSNYLSSVGDVEIRRYMDIAEAIADELTVDSATTLGCDPTAAGCIDGFIDDFGPRAFRRPLSVTERTGLRALFDSAEEPDFGVRLVVSAILQSPNFLYHVERGDGGPDDVVNLTDYELASRVSYFLWNTMPDPELFAAAADGLDKASLQAQVERMLNDDRAAASVGIFHRQWLDLDKLAILDKDPELFPLFSDAMAASMAAETEAFSSHVVLRGAGTLRELLTAPYTIADDVVLAIYGEDATPGDAGEPAALDATRRAGLLTQPGFLAAHSHRDQTSPVPRGVVIRQNLMCTALPPPPVDVDNTVPPVDPNVTARERMAQHRDNPSCSGCHEKIDGLGFGFEHYDAIGAYRTMDAGLPVDATGWVDAFDDEFDGAIELANRLSDSPEVRRCVAKQWFRYSRGRIEGVRDVDTLDTLDESFAASDGDIRALIVDIALQDAFATRGPVKRSE